MEMLIEFMTFYLVGAVIIGLMISGMRTVEIKFGDRALKHPRLFGFFFCGLVWPYVIFRMIFPR